MPKLTDQTYLRTDQYCTAANLNARIQLHARFSTSPIDWHRWVFERLALISDQHVFELGCGPGDLWVKNATYLPPGLHLTLTDFSPGMVKQARNNLGGRDNLTYVIQDAQALAFPAASFDVVIANHMLYHVPNRPAALAEIHRLLRPGGRFFAATNGETHMQDLYALLRRFEPTLPEQSGFVVRDFSLENGAAQLAPWFANIQTERFSDFLEITEVEPLVAYVLSMSSLTFGSLPPARLAEFRQFLVREIAAHGRIHIGKLTGMFIAAKP
jgi:ubiquinone/menaquinone biosynthesis C-methylase UbiE